MLACLPWTQERVALEAANLKDPLAVATRAFLASRALSAELRNQLAPCVFDNLQRILFHILPHDLAGLARVAPLGASMTGQQPRSDPDRTRHGLAGSR